MILIDATPLVALADERDPYHARAKRELDRLPGGGFVTCGAVLTEACYHLSSGYARRRLLDVFTELSIRPLADEADAGVWEEVFEWLLKYAEHMPDLADGMVAVLSGRRRRMKVWTYDSEFARVWRRPDGTKIPLAVEPSR